MTLLSESEVLREIVSIDDEPCGAMRKARRYLSVSRRLRALQRELRAWFEGPEFDGDHHVAQRVRRQIRMMRKLDAEVRVRAAKALRTLHKMRLGFGYGPHSPPKLFGARPRV